jgi:uncharacterized protein
MAHSDHTETFDLFHRAILDRRQVTCSYQGLYREICPHILGHRAGSETALVFQFGGESSKGLPAGGQWRCLKLEDVKDVKLRDGWWYTGQQHATSQSCVDYVFVDVNEDVPNQPGRR